MRLGEAVLAVKVDPSGARSGAQVAKQAFEEIKVKGEQAANKVGSAFEGIKNSVFSLKSAFAALGVGLIAKSFLDAGRETENYMIRLRILLGSVAEGNRLFKEMNAYAARTPFEFREVMNSATALAGVLRGGVDEIKGFMPLIADLATASGLGIQETTSQVIKMLSAGAGAADLFRERGILAMMGFTAGVNYSAEETRRKLISSWEDVNSKFRGSAESLVNTWDGAVSNLMDTWFQFQQRVMVEGGVLAYLKAIVQVLTGEMAGAIGANTDQAQTWAEVFISGLEQGVRGMGAVLTGLKYVGVAIEGVRAGVEGLALGFQYIWTMAAEAGIVMAKIRVWDAETRLLMAQMNPISRLMGQTAAMEEELAAETKLLGEATAYAAEQQLKLAERFDSSSSSIDKLFEKLYEANQEADFDEFFRKVNEQLELNKVKAEEAADRLGKFQSGLSGAGGAAGPSAEELKKFNDQLEDTRAKYDQVYRAEVERDRSLSILRAGYTAGKLSAEAYAFAVREVAKAYLEATSKGNPLTDQVDELKAKFISGYAAIRDRNKALKEADELHRSGALSASDYTEVIAGINRQFEDQTKKAEEATSKVDEWGKTLETAAQGIQGAFTSFFENLFDKGLSSFKDLASSIGDVFKRMLAEMATLAIARPIIVPVIQSLGGMMGLPQNALNGILQQFGGAPGAGSGPTTNPLGGFLNRIFGGGQPGAFTGGGSLGFGGGMPWGGGAGGFTGAGSLSYGNPAAGYGYGGTNWGALPPQQSPFGGATGWGGALAGAAWGATRGSGGLSTGLSTVAGGVAGFYGAGVAGAFASGGMAAGMSALGSIPVVGWIAAAAAIIDKISGGKLFGTKFQTQRSGFDVTIGAGGATGGNFEEQTRQRALFGGTARRTLRTALSSEQQSGFDELFEAVRETAEVAARTLGVEVPEMVSGSFKQIKDKKGNIVSETSTVLGETFKESVEEFGKRLQAENILAAIGVTVDGVRDISARWRANAEDLLDGASMLLAAQTDINAGVGLLGEDGSLGGIADIVERLAKGGESMVDSYTRLTLATQNYRQLLDLVGQTTNRTAEEVVEFAAAIADAAGGGDAAGGLYNSFFQNYFTPQERLTRRRDALLRRAGREVGDLGDAGQGLTFENFRERFEAALPSLGAEEVAEWLEAGSALADLNAVVRELAGAAPDAAAALQTALDAIDAIQQTINASLDASIEDIRLSQMSPEDRYSYFREQANLLADGLDEMTDPDQIAETVARINRLQGQAWGQLDEGQQAELADEFITFLEGVKEIAGERLEAAREEARAQAQELAEAIAEAMRIPAEQQTQAAQTMQEAGERIAEAADTLTSTPIQVVVVPGNGWGEEVGGFNRR